MVNYRFDNHGRTFNFSSLISMEIMSSGFPISIRALLSRYYGGRSVSSYAIITKFGTDLLIYENVCELRLGPNVMSKSACYTCPIADLLFKPSVSNSSEIPLLRCIVC